MPVTLIGAQPTDAVTAGQYYRAVWEGTLSSWLQDMVEIAGLLYGDLRSSVIPYASPINDPGTVDGDKVVVIDMRTFTPDGSVTVAQLANALNELRISAKLRTLELVQQSDVYGATGDESRANDKESETTAATSQSFLAGLGTEAKWIVGGVGVLVALMVLTKGKDLLKDIGA